MINTSSEEAQGGLSVRARWIAAIMLTGVFTLNSVDRFVISVVIEPLRHEYHFTDTQLGSLGGLAHALAYSAFVLPIGWLLDRVNRVRALAGMLAVWSLITALGGVASSYWQFFAVRMGVGAAEAITQPGVQTLVASMFPIKERASALGVVYSGVAIGTGLVFAVGGVVATAWGWRAVFLVACVPGLILAALLWLLVKEPARSAAGKQAAPAQPFSRAVALFFNSPPIMFSTAGITIASMSVASAWVWVTPILIRQHGFSLVEAGAIVGLAAGVIKFASTITSGFLGDLIAKGRIDRLWVIPTCALVLTVPAALGIAFAPSKLLVVGSVMLLGVMLGTHYSAPRVVVVTVTPDNMRGSVSSIMELSVNLLGAGMGPMITGMISDRLGGSNVGLALAVTTSFNLVGALCFWLASRGVRAPTDVAAATPATVGP